MKVQIRMLIILSFLMVGFMASANNIKVESYETAELRPEISPNLSFKTDLIIHDIIPSDTLREEGQLYVVTRLDGVEYIGFILSDDAREILLDTEKLGKIYIPKSDILTIQKINQKEDLKDGSYNATGPITTRYVFTTNALPIRKGENYSLLNLYGPEVHFALSDNFSLGLMSTWIASPFVLAAKYSFKTNQENVHFSIGTLAGTSGYLNNFRGYGALHFANVSFGDERKNLTLSAGYAYAQTGFENFYEEGVYQSQDEYFIDNGYVLNPLIKGPLFSIGGIIKVGAKASFIFDSMLGNFSTQEYQVKTTTIQDPIFDPEYIPGVYKHEVSNTDVVSFAMMLMPGMRFQSREDRAFQVALAGISIFNYKGWENTDNFSFPFPMCTWYMQF